MSEERRFRRRDVLRVAAATGLLGGAGVGVASGAPSGRHVVGTRNPRGKQKAKQMADSVHRDLDFGSIGGAVAGRFPEQAREALQKNPNVRYVEPDGQLQAIGQSLPWGVDRTDAELTAADGETGAGADVAIIDSGIDSDHPDLEANLGAGKAFAYCSGCAELWDDDNDHGTHCAGIVGAVDNSRAVVGVAPETTLHAVKVLQSNGWGSFSDIAAGVTHVADQGWDVASMSLGGDYSYTLADAIEYAHQNGVLLVAAAGNSGPCSDCVMFPASHPDTIAVSASAADDSLASFSSTGPEVDIVAPGQGVESTVRGGTAIYSGTSMACPHVSAAGGVLMSQGLSNTEARSQLEDSAEDIGLAANEQGNGLLDVEAAVGNAVDGPPSASVVAPADGATVSGTTTVQVDASDAEDDDTALTVEVSIDDGPWQVASYDSGSGAYTYAWDTTGVSDSDHTVEGRVTDSGGHSTSASVTVTVDNVAAFNVDSGAATDVGESTATLNGEVTSLGGADSAKCYAKYWEKGAKSSTASFTTAKTLSSPGTFAIDVSGLSSEMTYVFAPRGKASDGSWDRGAQVEFTTSTSGSTAEFNVDSAAATNVDDSSATLNGELTGLGGAESVDCYVKYWEKGAKSSTASFTADQTLNSAGTFDVAVSGLASETTYVFAPRGKASDGSWDRGAQVEFTISTNGSTAEFNVDSAVATDVGSTTATLNGEVTGLGGAESVDCYVKYWEKGAKSSTASFTTIQTLNSAGTFDLAVSGLSSDTTYVFAPRGKTSDGSWDRGARLEFTTK